MDMRLALVRNWWSLVLRGLLGIGVGVIALVSPGITLLAIVFLFAAYALIDGIVNIAGAMRAAETHGRWGVLVLEGVVGIAAGVIAAAWPGITAIALVYIIAAWALVTGVFEIIAAIRLRDYIRSEWLLGLAGVASIVFGILLASAPITGAVVLALWVGGYCFIFGVLMVILGFRLRSWNRTSGGGIRPIIAPAH